LFCKIRNISKSAIRKYNIKKYDFEFTVTSKAKNSWFVPMSIGMKKGADVFFWYFSAFDGGVIEGNKHIPI
jgi:hypothetical protein